MARKKQTADDRRVARAYARACNGVQIPMLQIPQIYKVGHVAIARGASDAELETAIAGYVETIKVKA